MKKIQKQFVEKCPPLLIILCSTALFFAIGYFVGNILEAVGNGTFDVWEWASGSALLFGYCGSILGIMRYFGTEMFTEQ